MLYLGSEAGCCGIGSVKAAVLPVIPLSPIISA